MVWEGRFLIGWKAGPTNTRELETRDWKLEGRKEDRLDRGAPGSHRRRGFHTMSGFDLDLRWSGLRLAQKCSCGESVKQAETRQRAELAVGETGSTRTTRPSVCTRPG